jgi:hypothetical protein
MVTDPTDRADPSLPLGDPSGVPGPRLFSIGHSNHGFDRFVRLLRQAAVTAVADVRSQPASARHPQFNRAELERELKRAGLAYVFLGEGLGGRPRDPSLYDDEGRLDYQRVRATAAFERALDRLERALRRFTVAVLCSEEDPLDCHRGLLIAPALRERGLDVGHLRGDGSIESMAQMEDRLLAETKVGVGILDGLFAATLTAAEQQALLAEAYRLRGARKAFRLRPDQSEGVRSRPGVACTDLPE